jgi:hypothetical protein
MFNLLLLCVFLIVIGFLIVSGGTIVLLKSTNLLVGLGQLMLDSLVVLCELVVVLSQATDLHVEF